jgi:hypothetical protein
MAQKKKGKIKLVELLAYNAQVPSRELLQKYGISDPKNTHELSDKLEQLYLTATDKSTIEKSFAEIHPHKDLILAYLSENAPSKTIVKVEEPLSAACGCSGFDSYSNCSGCGGTCGGSSNAEGSNINTAQPNFNQKNDTLALLTLVSIVALVGIFLNKK